MSIFAVIVSKAFDHARAQGGDVAAILQHLAMERPINEPLDSGHPMWIY
jgi:hypothetical protein